MTTSHRLPVTPLKSRLGRTVSPEIKAALWKMANHTASKSTK